MTRAALHAPRNECVAIRVDAEECFGARIGSDDFLGNFVIEPTKLRRVTATVGDQRVKPGEYQNPGILRSHPVTDFRFVASQRISPIDGVASECVWRLYTIQLDLTVIDCCRLPINTVTAFVCEYSVLDN